MKNRYNKHELATTTKLQSPDLGQAHKERFLFVIDDSSVIVERSVSVL